MPLAPHCERLGCTTSSGSAATSLATGPGGGPPADVAHARQDATVESLEEESNLSASQINHYWLKFKGTSLEPVLRVLPAERHSAMRLVDARYLLELGGFERVDGMRRDYPARKVPQKWWVRTKECGCMRRRQDLPARAFVSLADLQQARCPVVYGKGALPVVAVSYPWLQPDHPDPRGDTLTLLAYALASLLNHFPYMNDFNVKLQDIELLGVFIDFMSLHQKGAGIGRTGSEQRLFDLALESLAELYSHPGTMIFKVSRLPEGYPDGFTFPQDCTPNKADYYQRGWCHCESSVAGLTKASMFVLDIGKITAAPENESIEVLDQDKLAAATTGGLPSKPQALTSWKQAAQADRAGPMLPEDFAASLEHKSFTSKKADCSRVAAIYMAAFVARFAEAAELHYNTLQWDVADAQALARVLACGAAPLLKKLEMWNTGIGAAGMSALAAALPAGAAQLEVLNVNQNDIGDAGASALAEALSSGAAPLLRELIMNQNGIEDAGASAVAEALSSGAAPQLKQLQMRDNRIGDAGAIALAEALSSRVAPQVMTLSIQRNTFGEAGREALAALGRINLEL